MKDINSPRVWTALITPMLDNGSVDYEALEKLLKQQEAAGNAITILGSTGEALNIDENEKKKILELACNLNLSVPLMAGVGGINLNTQIEWIKYLNTLPLDCYLLVVPLYAKPGVYGQYGWFSELMDVSEKPCMIYNVPGRTAKNLELEALKMLAGHKNFWAIKEASGSKEEFAKYKAAAPDALAMSGDDLMLPVFADLGAGGVVSVASNVWPKETALYAEQCLNGSFDGEEVWRKGIEALFSASNPVPVKALMNGLGMINSPKVRLPLSEKDLPGLEPLNTADQSIKDWFARQKS